MSVTSNQLIENYVPVVKWGGLNTNKAVDFSGSSAVTLPSGTTIGGSSVAALGTVTSSSANALAVGPNGTTTPSFQVDASTASAITGIKVKSAATGANVAITALGGTNESITIAGKGTGVVSVQTPVETHLTAAINSTGTATATQVATGYITSTSAAATTITLPTGTALGTQLGAVQGTIFDLYIDNTAGANTVTIAVAVNGILSAAAAANAASQGLLTVPSGVTGQACFRLMFSSATAYTFTRIA
jgi:hypothetical protein